MDSHVSASSNQWKATFYPTINFTGKAVEMKYDELHFSWGHGSPHPSIPSDKFSARFEKTFQVTKPGKYYIGGRADDGVRIYVDGYKEVDFWKDGVNQVSKEIYLTEGTHTIKVDYYDSNWSATLNLDIVEVEENLSPVSWNASFYKNSNFRDHDYKQYYQKIDFKWGQGSPHSSIPNDNFTAVFQKSIEVDQAGRYKIEGVADDGARIYVDGKKVVDQWIDGVNNINKTIDLLRGTHTILVEYYDAKWSATLSLDVKRVGTLEPPTDKWRATYYPSSNLTGTPVVMNYDDIQFSWGHGSPHASIPVDYFSGIFERTINITEAGDYKFTGLADDGIRIYVDGQKVIDQWNDGVNNLDKTVRLTKGTHTVKIEYYDAKWSATLKVDLAKVVKDNEPDPITSDKWNARFYPTSDFTGTFVKSTAQKLEYYWGQGSPHPDIPTDSFSGVFERSFDISKAGKYQFVGKADDGIRIYVDGVKVVDQWITGVNEVNKVVDLTAGTHIVKVEYYDEKWSATLVLDLIDYVEPPPTDKWNVTYYPTANLTGTPIKTTAQQLEFYWGQGSPHTSIPTDYFSGVFEKSFVISKAGKYQFVGKADDGIRIYVDGFKVVDQWTTGVNEVNKVVDLTAGTHIVKVEYYDEMWSATLVLDLIDYVEPPPLDKWNATYYPTANFTGSPIKTTVNNIDFSWGQGSPHASIPNDYFSAVFERRVDIATAGKYRIIGKADDGIRIYVDGQKKVDYWKDGVNTFSYDLDLTKGVHTIKIEYYDALWSATLKVDLLEVAIKRNVIFTDYSISLNDALNKQLTSGDPQTDKKYDAYVRSDALLVTNNKGVSQGIWNVRGGPGTTYWSIGKTKDKEEVTILSSVKASDGWTWYKIDFKRSWVNASPEDVSYYLNPNSFSQESASYFQFLKLSESAGITEYEVNEKILKGKGILEGKAGVFIQASSTNNINEIYLMSHALLETGNGSSQLANGVKVKTKRDSKGNIIYADNGQKEIEIVTTGSYEAIVYNMYGVGALDSCALQCGARHAFNQGWTTPDKAIIGGAEFVAKNYIHRGQDTLYKMKWNPSAPATHQYASDIGWAVKQTTRIYQIYGLLDRYTLTFDVPRYK